MSPSQILTIFSSSGIPATRIDATTNALSFADNRLSEKDQTGSGKFLIFSSEEEAIIQYKTLISNNKTSQYIYQNKNVLLILSNAFTKVQAEQYKGIFSILGELNACTQTPSALPSTPAATKDVPTASPTATPRKGTYSDGTYVIGSIMPAGEYAILSSGRRCTVTLKKGTVQEHILYDASFYHNIILTVRSTEILTIKGGTAILLSKCNTLDPSTEGMFKVGTELAAGTYTISLSTGNIIGFGNVQIMKDSLFEEDSIISAKNFTNPITVTLKRGQYIKLSGACLIL